MNRSDQTSESMTPRPEQDAKALASMTLGERIVLAAQMAVREHLDPLDQQRQDQRRRNRQQAKRATTEQSSFGIGGAGGDVLPVWVRVTEDPALAPLTPHPFPPDQAEALRRLAARRLSSASSVEPRLRDGADATDESGGAAA